MKAVLPKTYINPVTDDQIILRGNKNICEKYGEDITLPRFIGDKPIGETKDGWLVYPSAYGLSVLEHLKYLYEDCPSVPKYKSKYKNTKQKSSNKRRQFKQKRSKADTKAWWRSLTAEEQTDYRYNKFTELGLSPNWNEIYDGVIKEGLYLK